jgi:hypothetical protein
MKFRLPRRRAAVIVTAAALALGAGAGAAFAAVSPSPNVNMIGSGGYVASTTTTGGFTANQAVIAGDQYGLTVAGGRHGIKMCNSTTGETAAAGLFSGNMSTSYAAQYGVSAAPGCPFGEGTLTDFPNLSAVPFGHHVWVSENLITRTRTVRILVCFLGGPHHPPVVPTPTQLPVTPTTSPATSTTSPATGTTSPAPATSTTTAATTALVVRHGTPGPVVTEPGAPVIGGMLPGDFFRCRIITRTITKNVVLFQADDLDAPTVTPVAGDLAGVQTAVVHLPRGTTFDRAGAGISENVTALTACTGGGFPITLNGTPPGQVADYASGACQPVSVFEYAGAQLAGGPFTDWLSLDTTEAISPSAGGALVAPNGSIAGGVNIGPHGPTASGASVTGSHFVMFTGNAPVA